MKYAPILGNDSIETSSAIRYALVAEIIKITSTEELFWTPKDVASYPMAKAPKNRSDIPRENLFSHLDPFFGSSAIG
jgi:hypothetical protein